jgi:hypothetical protein
VQRRLKVAVPYFALGTASLVVAAFIGSFPSWPIWLLFTGLFVLLESFAVEVNDRLFQSSSIMVVMTAGVIFVLDGSSAFLGMTLMTAAGAVVPDDFRQRRWFQPMANFGQLALSGGAAGLVLDLTLGGIESADTSDLLLIAVASALASVSYVAVNNLLVRRAV